MENLLEALLFDARLGRDTGEPETVDLAALAAALRLANPIEHAVDGVEALEILRGVNGRQRLAAPFLVRLALNLPRMNGLEFLSEIRNDSELRSRVVFVLTASSDGTDLMITYRHNVAGCIDNKKFNYKSIYPLTMIDKYLTICNLPGG